MKDGNGLDTQWVAGENAYQGYRWPSAIPVAWLVNIVTSIKWTYASYLVGSKQLATYAMGGNWYIVNYFVIRGESTDMEIWTCGPLPKLQ